MTLAASGAVVVGLPASDRDRRSQLDTRTAAWLMLVPCAALYVALMLFLGPALGRFLYSIRPAVHFWPMIQGTPQPTEQARYLLSVSAPVVLALATVAAMRRQPRLPARLVAIAVPAVQVVTVAFLIACMAGQYRLVFIRRYFSPATLAVAVALAAALATTLRSARARERLAAWLRESRGRHVGALVVAVAATALWMLPSINSDHSIAWANEVVLYHMAFSFDETFAVLNGLTPLATFTAQYGSLWPYAVALPMLAFGKTLLVFTIAMCTITSIAFLAVFALLRRLTRNSIAALLLFLPFVGTSLFLIRGTDISRMTFGAYFPVFPLRFGGPYLLAWLTARHLDGRQRTRRWPLFVAAGLVLLNNFEVGVVAFGATVAAVVWADLAARRRPVLRFAASVAGGLGGALALVSAVTLLRAGRLPDLGALSEFSRIYGVGGFSAIAIPGVLGLPLIVYATYVAAIGTATIRALRHEPDRALTGMLAWSGVFGLGAAAYYVTRAHPDTVPILFSAWALALALLTIAAVRHLWAHPRRPSVAILAVLAGMGIAVCSVAQLPMPWRQIDRIRSAPTERAFASGAPPYQPSTEPATRRFISSLADGPRRFVVRHGAPVALFVTTGHRIADAYGIVDVVPYTGLESVETFDQFDKSLDALARAGGNTVLIPNAFKELAEVLTRRGFEVLTAHGLRRWRAGHPPNEQTELGGVTKWVDMHRLHPRALRPTSG
jgi:hypothetical protein